jgi:hypothetical protein
MRAIKETLLERSYAQADAAELAKVDPEIDYDPLLSSYIYLGPMEVSLLVLTLAPQDLC